MQPDSALQGEGIASRLAQDSVRVVLTGTDRRRKRT